MLKFFTDVASALDALRRHAVLFLLGITIVALALLGRSWLDAHDAAARLQATLAAQQKTITDADQRQSTRDAQLTQTLAQIAAAEKKVQTPAQAATALTQAIPQLIAGEPGGQTLPSPITIELPAATSASKSDGAKSSGGTKSSAEKSGAATSAPQNANATSNTGDVAQFGAALSSATNSGDAQTSSGGPVAGSSAAPTKTKYPWTSLKLELARLGVGHATQDSSKKDLENVKGSSASQKGTTAAQNATGSSATGSASNANTNSLPPTSTNAQAATSSTQNNSAAGSSVTGQTRSSGTQTSTAAPAIIRVPQADLKPLFDAVEDCEVCQAKLTAAQADLTDETTKFAAATAQRDAAISAAHGTFWTRARTAAKWIVIGAAVGAVLSRYH